MNKINAEKLFHTLTNIFISSPYGYRDAIYDANGKLISSKGFHEGVDYAMQGKSIPVYALEDGVVLAEGKDSTGAILCYVHYPRLGYVGLYYHLACTVINKGDKVNKDTKLGMTGKTGNATGIHLHFNWFKYEDYNKAFKSRNYENFDAYVFPEYKPQPVTRNEKVAQIEVKVSALNIRTEANITSTSLGFATQGFYDIIDVEEHADYTWYKIGENAWIAYNPEWETIHPVTKTELEILQEEIVKLNNQISDLDNKLVQANKDNLVLKDKLKQINTISS